MENDTMNNCLSQKGNMLPTKMQSTPVSRQIKGIKASHIKSISLQSILKLYPRALPNRHLGIIELM